MKALVSQFRHSWGAVKAFQTAVVVSTDPPRRRLKEQTGANSTLLTTFVGAATASTSNSKRSSYQRTSSEYIELRPIIRKHGSLDGDRKQQRLGVFDELTPEFIRRNNDEQRIGRNDVDSFKCDIVIHVCECWLFEDIFVIYFINISYLLISCIYIYYVICMFTYLS